jgi:Holliday junction resolvasome RuvABC DNA-binding subunit
MLSKRWLYVDLDELEDIPGIGWKTVDALRLHGFRDVADVYSTSCSDWGTLKQVKGIGEKRAKNLFRLIEKYVVRRGALR